LIRKVNYQLHYRKPKEVRFVAFKENGSVSAEFESMLVDKLNYVVMETANTWMIKTTIMAMMVPCQITKFNLLFRTK
jgi:hypothetical protein